MPSSGRRGAFLPDPCVFHGAYLPSGSSRWAKESTMFFLAKYKRNAERLKMIFSNALHGVQEGSGFEWKAFVTHMPTELRVVRLSQELLRLWLIISNTVRDGGLIFSISRKPEWFVRMWPRWYSLGTIMQDTVTMSSLL